MTDTTHVDYTIMNSFFDHNVISHSHSQCIIQTLRRPNAAALQSMIKLSHQPHINRDWECFILTQRAGA